LRIATFAIVGATLLAWTSSAAGFALTQTNGRSPVEVAALKAATASPVVPPDPIYVDQGGDTIATATVIPDIPYTDTGTTASYTSNYESCVGCFECPYSTTGARDVVYSYTPTVDRLIDVDLCLSSYDTKVYIGDGGATPIIACNDDACGTGLPGPWQSRIDFAQLYAGHTYYIFVDGYSATDFGDYVLSMTDVVPCEVPCPPGATSEGEPICHDDYRDQYNGGCGSDPVVFTNLPCSDPGASTIVCATYGGFYFNGLSYRDTDWYQIVLEEPSTVTWCVEGEYDTLTGILDGRGGCLVTGFYDYNYGGGCTPLCVSGDLEPGTWWLWVGPLGFGASVGECGGVYVGTLTGYECGPTAVSAATWGRIKNTYR
jgi:hypothetical protein